MCNHPNVEEHPGKFALGFAFEVRKSLEDGQESKQFGAGRERVKYFGANNLWPHYLVHVALLRDVARLTEKALADGNLEADRFCREWLSHYPGVTRDYVSLFMEEGTRKFIFETPPKRHLASLPKLLRSFHWFSDEYRAFEKSVRAEAEKLGCSPQSLRAKGEWPSFKW